tara:strand:- start:2776 stop:3705 length:930 start_codon:yes stop_codon:yes gene_type:complete
MNYRKIYNENGYLIVRNLIKEDLISKVLVSLEDFKKKGRYYYTQSSHTWVRSNKITEEGFLVDSIQSPTKQINCGKVKFAVEEIICCKEISKILKELTGKDKFINWQNMLFDKSTGTLDHADTWYLDTKPRGEMIAAWIALEDINEKAGRFFVYPKSHKLVVKENVTKKIKDHYEYAKFIDDYIKHNSLKKYCPALRKGDVLFWHPFTLHGSHKQKSKGYSRKSLTAHYHPVGFKRIDSAETEDMVKKYIRKMRKSSNPSIFFDNSDPSNFKFTTISFAKWLIKKILLKNKDLRRAIMDRDTLGIKNKD